MGNEARLGPSGQADWHSLELLFCLFPVMVVRAWLSLFHEFFRLFLVEQMTCPLLRLQVELVVFVRGDYDRDTAGYLDSM